MPGRRETKIKRRGSKPKEQKEEKKKKKKNKKTKKKNNKKKKKEKSNNNKKRDKMDKYIDGTSSGPEVSYYHVIPLLSAQVW